MGTPLNVKEWMKGYLGVGATDTDAGFIRGFDKAAAYEHDIKILMEDVDRFVAEPQHVGKIEGVIRCDLFGGERQITAGVYNMLIDDKDPRMSFFFYKLSFTSADGKPYTLLGHKTVHNDGGLDLLTDITTLTVRVFEGDIDGPDVTTPILGPAHMRPNAYAMGVVHIHWLDGLRSGASFETPGANTIQRWLAIEKFMSFYMRRLWAIFSHPG
jgi:cholesterol oxidase